MNRQVNWIVIIVTCLIFGACTKSKKAGENVLNIIQVARIKGFDPIHAEDKYSNEETARVYETLFEYHYLKRPFVLQANLAASMPAVSEDNLTYTISLKKGVLFHDNKCFKDGKGREMVASDVEYSVKRMADVKNASEGWWLLDGRIEGLNEWRDANSKKSAPDYSASVSGIKVVDKYTIQFKLVKPYPQFLYAFAMPFTSVVAKEAVKYYGVEFLNHPVGTGPFTLEKFTQSNKITYHRNPNFRDKFYPSEGAAGDKEAGHLADAGKKIPFAEKIVVQIISEDQPQWLNFRKGKGDFLPVPKDSGEQVFGGGNKGKINADLKKVGINLTPMTELDVTYMALNMAHPLMKNENLRKAIALAYDVDEANEKFYHGVGLPAQSVVPPGIAGSIEGYVSPFRKRNLAKAKEYLKKAGYPEGKGLPEITLDNKADTTFRQISEHFAKNMSDIGIKVRVVPNTWPQLLRKVRKAQTMIHGIAWGADYPDAENFLQLLYSKNMAPGPNGANFNDKEFDRLFERARVMQDGPERTALYQQLNKYVANKVPWVFGVHRTKFYINHGWLKNYKPTPFTQGQEQYLRVDNAEKQKMIQKL